MTRRRVAAWLVVMALAGQGCATAPIGGIRGPVPPPPSRPAFDVEGPSAFLASGTTDREAHRLGTLAADRADSLVLVVYGDNRPGLRLLTTPWGMGAITHAELRDPVSLLWGAINLPVLAVQAILPTLDGVQDLVSATITHVYCGGGESRVLRALERERGATAAINTGDLVENGTRGVQWEHFAARHETLRRRLPLLAAPGNHERLNDPWGRFNWDRAMGPPADTLRYWFLVDLPDSLARFVFLDSNVFADPHRRYPDSLAARLAEEQLEWLDVALAGRARWMFVVMHHPIVSAGQHLGDWARDDPGASGRRSRLIASLARHRVTALLTGHEHLYQRLWLDAPDGAGFWQITTGGGGSPLHRISKVERREARGAALPGGLRVTWAEPRSVYHYCRLVIPTGSGEPQLEVRHVRGGDAASVIERVSLARGPEEDP